MIKKLLCSICGLILLFSFNAVQAFSENSGTLQLPQDLTTIEEDAFRGVKGVEKVVCPEGLETIEKGAFAESSVKELVLPASLRHIGEGAFDKAPLENVSAPSGSYAETWANERGYLAGEVTIGKSTFPDESFRNYVLQNFDTDDNGLLSRAEIEAVTSIYFYYGSGITDLTGIRYFTFLESLYCNGNELTSLDLSGCTSLRTLFCSDNQLVSLNVKSCIELEYLDCSYNQLTALNVCNCAAITALYCNNNLLMNLDVSGCTSLAYISFSNNQLTELNASGCTSLTSLYIYSSDAASLQNASLILCDCTALERISFSIGNNTALQLESLNISGCTALSSLSLSGVKMLSMNVSGCTALESLEIGNYQLDYLDASNCTALEYFSASPSSYSANASFNLSGCTALKSVNFTRYDPYTDTYFFVLPLPSLDLRGCSALTSLPLLDVKLTSLNISGCSAMTDLNYQGSQLAELYADGCTLLTELRLDYNQLTSLDISGCTALSFLQCSNNQLTALDLNGCTGLKSLECGYNQLTSLDVSGCTMLSSLDCRCNQLMSLDVSGCTALSSLNCYSNQLTSLNVSGCIALSSLNYGGNQLMSLDMSGCTSLSSLDCCNYNQLTSLDVSGCTALSSLDCRCNQLMSLDVSGCTALSSLNCYSNQLTSLDVSGCAALSSLSCGDNQLMSLDVSGCAALSSLSCRSNQLTSLDVSGCTALSSLSCGGNQLTSLDVSACTVLSSIDCYSNHLMESVSLPVTLTSIGSYDFAYCTSLTSIYIPESVVSIAENAFYNTPLCVSAVEGSYAESWAREKGILRNETYASEFTFEKYSDHAVVINYSGSEKEIVIPAFYENLPVTEIGCFAFYEKTDLVSITIPDSVTRIGWSAFRCCSSLTSIVIPDPVSIIEENTFEGCSSLQSIMLPMSLISIESAAFKDCMSLRVLYYPDSIESIAGDAYEGCENLSQIYIYESESDPTSTVEWSTEQGTVYLGIGQEYKPSVVFQELIIGKSYNYTLTSSNPEVVSVNGDTIRMRKHGSATITGTVGQETKSFEVHSGLELEVSGGYGFTETENGYSLTLEFGKIVQLIPKPILFVDLDSGVVSPWDTSWEVWNGSVARCDEEGYFRAVDCGTSYVYVNVLLEGKSMTVCCKVTVPPQPITDIEKLDADTFNIGENEIISAWAILPKGQGVLPEGQGGSLHITSSNPSVVEVLYESGVRTRLAGRSPGEATITATAENGKSKSITIYVHGNGFKWEDPNSVIYSLGKTAVDPLTRVLNILGKKGPEIKSEKEAYLTNRVRTQLLVDYSLPVYVRNAFYDVFNSQLAEVFAEPSSYVNCKTDYELTNRIVAELVDGMDKGTFTFKANDGKTVHTYTCEYSKISSWGASYYQGTITDEYSRSYIWGGTQVNPVNIEAYLGYLKEYADLKVKEAKKALINDSLALFDFERVLSFLDSAIKEEVLSEMEKVVPGISEAVERLNADYHALKDLKQNANAICNSYNPKAKNPESLIRNIVDFHKQAEAIVADLSTLFH